MSPAVPKPATLPIVLPTRLIDPKLATLLQGLQPGQRIRITHVVRVGKREWTTIVSGIFREINYLETGLATHRVPGDDLIVPLVHFTKDNGELSSISLDENTKVEL